jgi:hypothetical protein
MMKAFQIPPVPATVPPSDQWAIQTTNPRPVSPTTFARLATRLLDFHRSVVAAGFRSPRRRTGAGCAESGTSRVYGERIVAKIISVGQGRPPGGEHHWTGPAVADEAGVSPSTVLRVCRDNNIPPFRSHRFKVSANPYLPARRHSALVSGKKLRTVMKPPLRNIDPSRKPHVALNIGVLDKLPHS